MAAPSVIGCAGGSPTSGCQAPGRCKLGTSGLGGGRGLYADSGFQRGEALFSEPAVLDSAASPAALGDIFAADVARKAALTEPIWGIVANFAAAARARGAGGGTAAGPLRDFYRQSSDARGEMYEEHAKYIHGAMLPEARQCVSADSLAELLQLVRLNAHNVSISPREASAEFRAPAARIGLGLFFWLHLANHSCAPNAFFTAASAADGEPATMTLRALHAIGPGDEVCISYVEGQVLLCPVQLRRRILQQRFGFLCMCRRCCEEASAAG